MQRRGFIKASVGLLSSLWLMPLNVFAAIWHKPAFETAQLSKAMQHLGVQNPVLSAEIKIVAPDRAENGAIVQVEVLSQMANTELIAILVEKNPTPLIATFKFSDGAEGFVITRIKMAETSDVTVIVKAGSQYFINQKNVVVLENGCG